MSARRDPYIMPHERRVLTVRQHPLVVLWQPMAASLALLIVSCWASIAGPGGLSGVSWLAFLASLMWLGWRALEWGMTYLVLTNLRLVVIDGVLVRRVSMVPLAKVVDMTFERPALGLLLNYGKLTVEEAHPGHPLKRIGYLPRIDEIYNTICGMLFADPEAREGE